MLSVFEKSYEEKTEKNPILVYPGLRYTHKKLNFACKIFFSKNVCLITKIDLRLKKNTTNFWGQFQKYLEKFCRRHQKNASHTISINGNCMTSVFFSENKNKKSQSFQS